MISYSRARSGSARWVHSTALPIVQDELGLALFSVVAAAQRVLRRSTHTGRSTSERVASRSRRLWADGNRPLGAGSLSDLAASSDVLRGA